MTASYIYVLVHAVPAWPEDHMEKRWQMRCNGLLTNPLQLCTGPLGEQTELGPPVFAYRADLYAAADAAGWKRYPTDEKGVMDYCSIAALLLGL